MSTMPAASPSPSPDRSPAPASKPHLSFWQILSMNFGFFGIQYSFGMQQTAVNPVVALELVAAGGGVALESTPLDEFVERIPFRETRGYVKRVSSTWQTFRYAQDLDSTPFVDLSAFNHIVRPVVVARGVADSKGHATMPIFVPRFLWRQLGVKFQAAWADSATAGADVSNVVERTLQDVQDQAAAKCIARRASAHLKAVMDGLAARLGTAMTCLGYGG